MAETSVMSDEELLTEVEEILDCIHHTRNFILAGGAGSGKTHSLLEVLKSLYEERPSARVACITYTHVAVNELVERAPFRNLRVSTIHEFLWSVISRFQKNLKIAISDLVAIGEIRYTGADAISPERWSGPIRYKEWLSVKDGVVSHDEILKIAEYLFSHYPLMSRIFSTSFDFIFIDEYQDTPPPVMRILLEHVPANSNQPLVVGLFGDRAQAIFEEDNNDAILSTAAGLGGLHTVVKRDNRRNPAAVLRVINQLRDDDLIQEASQDTNAPNYLKQGSAKFLYSNEPALSRESMMALDHFDDWDFSDSTETKLLYLGKSSIAQEANFAQMMAIYKSDKVLSYVDRVKMSMKSQDLHSGFEGSFGEAIEVSGALPTAGQKRFIEDNPELLKRAAALAYSEVTAMYMSDEQLIGTKKTSEYDDRDRGQKRDALISHLFEIEDSLHLYQTRRYNDFLRKTQFSVRSVEDKRLLKTAMDALGNMRQDSIEQVINFAHSQGIRRIDDNLNEFLRRKSYVFDRVKGVNYSEIASLYQYTEDHTPFSTQHGIKGAEFRNVFVSLDNAGWNNYNFEALFGGKTTSQSVLDRTKMMLYVSCSRAKDHLVVYFTKPNADVVNQAQRWFGPENVHDIGLET